MKYSRTVHTRILSLVVLAATCLSLLPIFSISAGAVFNNSPDIEDGKDYVFLIDNMALNVYGYPTDGRSCADIRMNPFDGEGNEFFTAHVTGNDYYFTAKYDTHYVLNIYGGAGARSGDPLKVYRTNSPANDLACLFRIATTSDGYVRLYNPYYGYYIGVEGTSDGSRVYLTDHAGSAKFRLYEVVCENSDVLSNGKKYAFTKYGSSGKQCINVQYRPSSGSGNIVEDPLNNEDNEIFTAHYQPGTHTWWFEAAYRPLMLNAYGGSDCRRGDQVVAYATTAASAVNDRACQFIILRDSRGILFWNLACGLFIDSYGYDRTGSAIRFYTQDSLSSNDQIFTPVAVGGQQNASAEPDVVYNQTESRWKKVSFASGYTMYSSACGVFGLCNAIHAVNGYSFSDDDIKAIAQYAIDKRYRIAGNGTSKALCQGLARDHGSDYGGFRTGDTYYYTKGKNADVIKKFDSTLDNGGALYFSVNSSSGGHIVAITGKRNINGKTQYLLVDSYPSSNRVGGTYGWVTIDDELDLHTEAGKKIVTKGSGGFYTIYAD